MGNVGELVDIAEQLPQRDVIEVKTDCAGSSILGDEVWTQDEVDALVIWIEILALKIEELDGFIERGVFQINRKNHRVEFMLNENTPCLGV